MSTYPYDQPQWKKLQDPMKAIHYDIFSHCQPQLENRRFERTTDDFRNELRQALETISSNDRRSVKTSDPSFQIATDPPQNSRVTLSDSSVPLILPDKTASDTPVNPAVRVPKKPIQQKGPHPTRSFHHRRKNHLMRRLADSQRKPRHHVHFHHFDHREYDRDVHRGVRGRGLMTWDELEEYSSYSSSDSESSSSTSSRAEMINFLDFEKHPITEQSEIGYRRSQMNVVAQYLHHHLSPKYVLPKEAIRHRLNHAVRHFLHRFERGWGKKAGQEDTVCPEDLVEAIWNYRKYWPLYRLKSKFPVLKHKLRHEHSHLRVRGHAIPRRATRHWHPDDPLHHCYGALIETRKIGCHEPVQPDVNATSTITEHLPMLGRHSRSLTSIVTHLLHSEKRFSYLYERSAPAPLVKVGKMLVPLDERFIRHSISLLKDPRFALYTGDPDGLAITAAKLISSALDHGLVESFQTLEKAPDKLLGRDWNKRLTGVSPSLPEEVTEDTITRDSPDFDPEFITELGSMYVEKDTPSTATELDSDAGSNFSPFPEVQPIEDADESLPDGATSVLLSREPSLSSSIPSMTEPDTNLSESPPKIWLEEILPRTRLTRLEFQEIKASVILKRKLRKISRILAMVQRSSIFEAVVNRRLLMNARLACHIDAFARRRQYTESPEEFAHRAASASPWHKPAGKKRRKKKQKSKKIKKAPNQLTVAKSAVSALMNSKSAQKKPPRIRVFQKVLVTRRSRVPTFVAVTAIERTKLQFRWHERLRKRFHQPVKKGRELVMPEESAVECPLNDAKSEGLVNQPHVQNSGAWKKLCRGLKCAPYNAVAYSARAAWEDQRNPELSLRDSGIAVAIPGLTSSQIGSLHLNRAICHFKLGHEHYDYAMSEIRTSVAHLGYTPQNALMFACYCFYRKQIFRALSYFVLAIQATPMIRENVSLRFEMHRALALLLFRTHQVVFSSALSLDRSIDILVI